MSAIIDQINYIALESLHPGPAAFLHQYLWDKIHRTHVSHSRRGVRGSDMAIVPEMMIKDVYDRIFPANKHIHPSGTKPECKDSTEAAG